MSNGLDTRTAVDGFIRGTQAGNNMFDAHERRLDRKEDREWTKKARDRQAGEWVKKDDLEKIQGFYTRLANKDQLSKEEVTQFGELQENYPQYKLGRFLDKDAKKNVTTFKSLFDPETPTNLKSPETLQAATAVLEPWLNKNTKDGQRKVVSMIAPSKTKGAVVIGVNVLDKDGNVIAENKPITVGRRNEDEDPEGKDPVLDVPVDQLIKQFRGYEIMSSLQDDPEVLTHAKRMAIQNGWISQPKGNYAVGRNDTDAFIYDKNTGRVAKTFKGSGPKGSGSGGRKIKDTDSVAVILEDWRDSQAKLVDGGMGTPEAESKLNELVYDQYGVTMQAIQGARRLLQSEGIAREPTVGEARKFMLQLQRAQKELEESKLSQQKTENNVPVANVPPRAGLGNVTQPSEENLNKMSNWGLSAL